MGGDTGVSGAGGCAGGAVRGGVRAGYPAGRHDAPPYQARLLYDRLSQRYTAGETVVFEKDGTRYTGRVAARGGDTVEVTDTALLLINGSVVAEPDIYEQTPRYDNGVQYPLTLADGEYFILCDARAGARDSRWFGAVRTGEIRGRVIALLRRSGI